MSARLQATLERLRREGRAGLSIYWPHGYPSSADGLAFLDAAIAGGADWLEVGIPFSDPAADGPTLQAASAQALAGGATVAGAFEALRSLRAKHPETPLVAMTYANLVHRRGWDGFAQALAESGADGLIVPDASLEDAGPLRAALAAHGLAHIPLVAPTTTPERMQAIAATAMGFLYVVANVGVTGQTDLGARVEATLAAARAAAPRLCLAVGFGVRSADDARRLRAAGADAVIVGSHVVSLARDGCGPGEVRAEVARLRAGTLA